MPARRRRRPGSDRLYVTSADGLPLGHLDLITRVAHDVPAALGAGVEAPEGGWSPGWEDLALHRPGHGLLEQAAEARIARGPEADRPYRLRADGQHAVAEALGKLTRAPSLRRGRGPRWRILHTITMAFDEVPEGSVVLDHLVVGPPGVFVVEVVNIPGGRVGLGDHQLDLGGSGTLDLGRRRRIGLEAADRVSVALARAAGATETLDPPAVHPVVAVVGAILVGQGRPRGVTVTRVGQLPRLLTAFGAPLSDLAVAQIHEVARRSTTWTP